jgi:hypothetical protein
MRCHVSCVACLGRRILQLGCCMAHRKETTIERIYREITGNKMPAAVKSILLPKRSVKRHQWSLPVVELGMPSDAWIKTLAEGRRVKFTNQELPNEWTFITAQVEGNKVVYSIILTNKKNPLRREEVESHFAGELSKK